MQKEYCSAAAIGEKARDRLVGSVGEEQTAQRLDQTGHAVFWADAPNNEAWELLVAGVELDVKTVGDLGNTTFAHDDIIYLVAEDAAGTTAADNVERLEGLSHAGAADSLEAALADTPANAGAIAPVPVVGVALAGWRETRAVRQGRDVAAAGEHGAADAAVKGTEAGAGLGEKRLNEDEGDEQPQGEERPPRQHRRPQASHHRGRSQAAVTVAPR